jgi:hypothetical protein
VDFVVTYFAFVDEWRAASNTLVILAVPDELTLGRLCLDAESAGLRLARVYEPDLGGALTSAAFEPAAHDLLRGLRLALAPARRTETDSPSLTERR